MRHLRIFLFFVVLFKIVSQAWYISKWSKIEAQTRQSSPISLEHKLQFQFFLTSKWLKGFYPIWIDRIPLNFGLKWSRRQDINEQSICFNTKTNWEKNNRCLGLLTASTFYKSSFNLWKLEDKLGVFICLGLKIIDFF